MTVKFSSGEVGQAYGCRVPSTEPLTDGASIVIFDECRHPLAVVDLQRPIDDVWTDSTLAVASRGGHRGRTAEPGRSTG